MIQLNFNKCIMVIGSTGAVYSKSLLLPLCLTILFQTFPITHRETAGKLETFLANQINQKHLSYPSKLPT